LDYATRSSITVACVNEKLRGPAPYARCINAHLKSIGINPNSGSQPKYVLPVPSKPRNRLPPASARKPPKPKPRERTNPNEIVSASSGSGFAVSTSGHVITNHHVIEGCQKVKIHHNGKTIPASVVTFDPKNDLALLKGEFRPSTVLSLNTNGPELLQDVYVAGFPFGRRVSAGVKVTKGIISSLTGIGNNFSNIQIDAALQPGNSGGPILDDKGNVVGVAVARLDKVKTLKKLGSLPENTNFGIKTSVVRSILESKNISSRKPNTALISKTKLGKMIVDGTYYLSCWMTTAQIEKMRSKKVIFQNLD
jgi:S1-C subfamily serine protease